MSTFPGSPKLVKGGIVLIDPETAAVKRIITLQYNPDSITRTLQVKGNAEDGERSEALRLKGPPVETIKLEAEIDATDQLETAEVVAVSAGIHTQLAALETMVYPESRQMLANNSLARSGTLEIAPMQASLALFIWSKARILPVKITEFSVTEEAFDVNLNPLRARVTLGLRVLSVDDLGFDHKGGVLFMNYQQNKERLAAMLTSGSLDSLGIGEIP